MTLPSKQNDAHTVFHESLNNPESDDYWRARLTIAATIGVAVLAAFTGVLQIVRGSRGIGLILILLLLILGAVPLILRRNGSMTSAPPFLNIYKML